jgi:hypothetical protein
MGPGVVWDEATRTHIRRSDAIARSYYTEMLLAKYPWLDTFDLRMFLMGFDAGEQWILHKDSENKICVQTPSWISSGEKTVGHVPDRVRHEMRAASGQTSGPIPAAIAGVTPNAECTRQKL